MIFRETKKMPVNDNKTYVSYPIHEIQIDNSLAEMTIKFEEQAYSFFENRLPIVMEIGSLEKEHEINFDYECNSNNYTIKFTKDIHQALEYLNSHKALSQDTYLDINKYLVEQTLERLCMLLDKRPLEQKSSIKSEVMNKLDQHVIIETKELFLSQQ